MNICIDHRLIRALLEVTLVVIDWTYVYLWFISARDRRCWICKDIQALSRYYWPHTLTRYTRRCAYGGVESQSITNQWSSYDGNRCRPWLIKARTWSVVREGCPQYTSLVVVVMVVMIGQCFDQWIITTVPYMQTHTYTHTCIHSYSDNEIKQIYTKYCNYIIINIYLQFAAL